MPLSGVFQACQCAVAKMAALRDLDNTPSRCTRRESFPCQPRAVEIRRNFESRILSRNDSIWKGSAGVAPVAFGLWPKTFRREKEYLLVKRLPSADQPRRPSGLKRP